ncbi:MAG TPA: CPBP family intramembrane glutamic endopeptidase [Acidisarcina sp.]
MTAEPEYLPPESLEEIAARERRRSEAPPRYPAPPNEIHPGQPQPESYVIPRPELPFYDPALNAAGAQPIHAAPGFYTLQPARTLARLIPNLGHSAIFFLLAFFVMLGGEELAVRAARHLRLFSNLDLQSIAADARLSIPAQAVEYLALFAVSASLFAMLWRQPFLSAIHWNARSAISRLRWLVPIGIVLGFVIILGGDFLPMPKNAPIVEDMMNSATGAWLMFLFSFTGAPLMEELAFRGFLLPSILNAFRWSGDRGLISPTAVRWIGLPTSILLTSCCFALMHSPQVSNSWGAVMLIGIVSVVLCIVRMQMNSVLASAIVHAAYNFTLFAGILFTTGGFRHLDNLKG